MPGNPAHGTPALLHRVRTTPTYPVKWGWAPSGTAAPPIPSKIQRQKRHLFPASTRKSQFPGGGGGGPLGWGNTMRILLCESVFPLGTCRLEEEEPASSSPLNLESESLTRRRVLPFLPPHVLTIPSPSGTRKGAWF